MGQQVLALLQLVPLPRPIDLPIELRVFDEIQIVIKF